MPRQNGMHAQTWKLAAAIGLLLGIVVASAMTFMDWRANPGGIFHGETGTNWTIIMETAISWWWPVTLITMLATVIFLYAVTWFRSR